MQYSLLTLKLHSNALNAMLTALAMAPTVISSHCWSFEKKDLYLVITLKLIIKPVPFTWKAYTFHFSLCFSLFAALFTFRCTFHMKSMCFSLFAVLFTWKACAFTFHCAFHMKSTVLFTFHCAFHWKVLHLSVKSTKTDSTQISQFDLVFHRVQR